MGILFAQEERDDAQHDIAQTVGKREQRHQHAKRRAGGGDDDGDHQHADHDAVERGEDIPFCGGSSRPLKGILSETVVAAYLLYLIYLIVVSCSPSEKRQRRGCRLSERDLLPSPLSGK